MAVGEMSAKSFVTKSQKTSDNKSQNPELQRVHLRNSVKKKTHSSRYVNSAMQRLLTQPHPKRSGKY